MSADRTQAGVGSGLSDIFFEIIHVAKGRHPAADELRTGQRRPQPDELRRDELTLHWHHIAHQPHVQAQVIGQTAQQRHRDMRMRVDQPGHQDLAAAIDGLIGGVFLLDLIGWADRQDTIALDGHSAGSILVEFFVHRQDEGVGEEEAHSFCHSALLSLEKGGFSSRLNDIKFGQL